MASNADPTLAAIPTEQLQAELERRARVATAMPLDRANPDFETLKTLVVLGLHAVRDDGAIPKDLEHQVWEEAVTAVYGERIWDWMKARIA